MGGKRYRLPHLAGRMWPLAVFAVIGASAFLIATAIAGLAPHAAAAALGGTLEEGLKAGATSLAGSLSYFGTTSLQILVDPDVQDILSPAGGGRVDPVEKTRRMKAVVESIFSNGEAHHVASVIVTSPMLPFSYYYLGYNDAFRDYRNKYYPRIRSAAGGLVAIDDEPFDISTGVTTVRESFAVARLIRDSLFQEVGYLVIFVDHSILRASFADLLRRKDASLIVLTDSQRCLFARGPDTTALSAAFRAANRGDETQAVRFVTSRGRGLVAASLRIDRTGWTIASAAPFALGERLRVESALIVAMAAAFCVLATAYVGFRCWRFGYLAGDSIPARLRLPAGTDRGEWKRELRDVLMTGGQGVSFQESRPYPPSVPFLCVVMRFYREADGRVTTWEGPIPPEEEVVGPALAAASSACGCADIVPLSRGRFAIFVPLDSAQGMADSVARSLAARLVQVAPHSRRLGVHIGQSVVHRAGTPLGTALEEADAAVESSFYEFQGTVFAFSRPAEVAPTPDPEIVDSLTLADTAGVLERWRAYARALGSGGAPPALLKARTFSVMERIKLLLEESGERGGCSLDRPARVTRIINACRLEDVEAELRAFLGEVSSLLCRATRAHDIVQRVREHVKQHVAENMSLRCISRTFFIDPNYFCRLFKERTGTNFSRWLAEVRIAKAIELMRTTDLSTDAIAERVGYQSPNYFVRVFKKVTGVTVSHFKKETLGITGKTFVHHREPAPASAL